MRVFLITYQLLGKTHFKFLKLKNESITNKTFLPPNTTQIIPITPNLNSSIKLKFSSNTKKEYQFINELNILLQAHIPLLESIEILLKSTKDNDHQKLLTYLQNHLKLAIPIQDYFLDEPFFLSPLSISFFKMGMQTHNMAKNISSLHTILLEKITQKKKLIDAFSYPIFLICLCIVIFTVIFTFIVPEFQTIFQGKEAYLPALTRALFWVSKYFWILFALFIGTITFLMIFFFVPIKQYQNNVDTILLRKIPFVSKVIYTFNFFEWYLILYTHLEAKHTLFDALTFSKELVQNSYFKKKIEYLLSGLLRGQNIPTLIGDDGFFNSLDQGLFTTAHESNSYTMVFSQLLTIYKTKLNDSIKFAVVILEPILILIIATIILLVSLGLFVPMWDFARIANI